MKSARCAQLTMALELEAFDGRIPYHGVIRSTWPTFTNTPPGPFPDPRGSTAGWAWSGHARSRSPRRSCRRASAGNRLFPVLGLVCVLDSLAIAPKPMAPRWLDRSGGRAQLPGGAPGAPASCACRSFRRVGGRDPAGRVKGREEPRQLRLCRGPAPRQHAGPRLSRCEWIACRQQVIVLGPCGTGMTQVAFGLGLVAWQKGPVPNRCSNRSPEDTSTATS